MLVLQDEMGDPTGAQEDKKWQKLTKIMHFQNLATIHFTQVKFFCYFYMDPMQRKLYRMVDENEDFLRPNKGALWAKNG